MSTAMLWGVFGFLTRWTLRTTETRLQIGFFLILILIAEATKRPVGERVRWASVVFYQLVTTVAILISKIIIEGPGSIL